MAKLRLTTRQLRYEYLRRSGFLHFESLALSKIAWNQTNPETGESICPYMVSEVIAPRRLAYYRFFRDKRRSKTNQEAWIAKIKSLYKNRDWYTTTEKIKDGKVTRRRQGNPWAQIKVAEKRWKEIAGPGYESPNIKRHRDLQKLEKRLNTRLQQPHAAGYITPEARRQQELQEEWADKILGEAP